jgi:hypothetical protein
MIDLVCRVIGKALMRWWKRAAAKEGLCYVCGRPGLALVSGLCEECLTAEDE